MTVNYYCLASDSRSVSRISQGCWLLHMNYLGRRLSELCSLSVCVSLFAVSNTLDGATSTFLQLRPRISFFMGADMFSITYACLFFSQSREPAYIPPPAYLCCVNAIGFFHCLDLDIARPCLFIDATYISSCEISFHFVTLHACFLRVLDT